MKIKLILFLSLLSLLSFGQAPKLSKDAKISILTCSPGPELHEIFGHSAIRIDDKENNVDWVFNWGTFDFDTPHFYIKFVRGSLLYTIGLTSYDSFISSYMYYKRSVYEQTLDLDSISKQAIADAIIENYKPENCDYKYDFQLDNCATRIRDIVENNCSSKIAYSFPEQNKSYRDILREYLKPIRWTDWGINTLLGCRLDERARTRDYMYIPDYVMHLFDSASINGKSIIKDKICVYKAPQTIFATPWYYGPELCFALVACLFILYSLYCIKKKIVRRWPDYIFFGITGLVGLLLLFLSCFSDYYSMPWNYNILIFMPSHLIALAFIHKRNNRFLKMYFVFTYIIALLCLSLFFLSSIGLQVLPLASISLILIIVTRAYMISKNK